MAKQNWIKLKEGFMLGDFVSIREFAKIKGMKYNGSFTEKTRGWLYEKRDHQNKQSKATKEMMNKKDLELKQAKLNTT